MGGRIRSIELLHLAAGGLEVEIVAGCLERVDLGPGLRADRNKREAGRQHEGFLGTDAEDVDPPGIRSAFHGPHAGDAIDREDRACLRDDLADGFDRVAGSRGRLAQGPHDARGIGMLFEGLGDVGGVDGLAPLGVEHDRVDPERLADIAPAGREMARVQDQGLAAGRYGVDRRRFHRSRSGCGENQNVVLSLEHFLQSRGDFRDHLFRLGRTVVNHRPR